jgi:asparagine synthase (glutamine-hydrolysing)
MCGIFGFILSPDKGRSDSLAIGGIIKAMSNATTHRGPDDLGYWLHDLRGGFSPPVRDVTNISGSPVVALGHRRLSIIDTSPAGWQPMVSKNKHQVLTFNGEIYNYVELRQELMAQGASFSTQTDTEVLLEGYRIWGESLFPRLVGMFAFCLVDLDTNVAILARDPFGIKPFHYTFIDGQFVFASEIKAILQFPGVSRRGNRAIIQQFLETGEVDTDESTFFDCIKKLPAACYAKLDLSSPGSFSYLHRYWDPGLSKPQKISWSDAVDKVRAEFLGSVRLHLRSDVPVGAALSGGIDSSAIVAAMRKLKPDADIRTFSYVADDQRLSEEKWVDIVTSSQSTKAFKVRADHQELLRDVEDLIRTQDEPFGSTSIYAQYRVFKLAKETGVTVMLDGQGADEMFAGYRPYIGSRLSSLLVSGNVVEAHRLLKAYRGVDQGAMRTVASMLSQQLPSSLRSILKQGYRRLKSDRKTWLRKKSLTQKPERESSKNYLTSHLIETLTKTSLPGLLRYEDRNSMRFSIESRVPFLTTGMASLALSLPEEFHVNPEFLSKAIFRAAMRGIVPDAILDRKDKVGFETPDSTWMRQLTEYLLRELDTSKQAIVGEFLDIERLKAQIQVEPDTFAKFEVWRILNFVKWATFYEVT